MSKISISLASFLSLSHHKEYHIQLFEFGFVTKSDSLDTFLNKLCSKYACFLNAKNTETIHYCLQFTNNDTCIINRYCELWY